MKSNRLRFPVLASLLFVGCMQSAKDTDYQPMEMTAESQQQQQAVDTAAADTPPTTTTEETDHSSLESQLDTEKPAAPQPAAPQFEQPSATGPAPEVLQQAEEKYQATETDPLVATPLPENNDPTPPIPSTVKKVKTLKSEIKFKVSKKASAKAIITDDNKGIHISFSTSKMKKNTYTLMLENSCKKEAKKGKKSKPVKVAQFKVKDGTKFSGKSDTKAISLRKESSKFAGKKALALYMGAKANVRVSCETIKIK